MPSDPLEHSLDHFHAEIAADPDIQDALRRLNDLHVPDPREQRFDATKSNKVCRGLLIGIAAGAIFWAAVFCLLANWNW